MDKRRFSHICESISASRVQKGIGTLKEKTLHAVLKAYYEEYEGSREVKIGSFIADIAGENGIIEIQTAGFDRLRRKLEAFLCAARVTVVYPAPHIKWLSWVDEATGEVTARRKSPKKGSAYDCVGELYKIKPFLNNNKLEIHIVLVDLLELRLLNGWSADKKKGASRYERIPEGLKDIIILGGDNGYSPLIAENLPPQFTSEDFRKAAGINKRRAQICLNILNFTGEVVRTGKQGRSYVYEISV